MKTAGCINYCTPQFSVSNYLYEEAKGKGSLRRELFCFEIYSVLSSPAINVGVISDLIYQSELSEALKN